MVVRCPSIDWRGFFVGLAWAQQREFESQLARRGITLGEYMEIFEQAALEVSCQAASQGRHEFHKEELLSLASSMLTSYVGRKEILMSRVLLERTIQYYKWPAPRPEARRLAKKIRDQASEERFARLSAAIHMRIEQIKTGKTAKP